MIRRLYGFEGGSIGTIETLRAALEAGAVYHGLESSILMVCIATRALVGTRRSTYEKEDRNDCTVDTLWAQVWATQGPPCCGGIRSRSTLEVVGDNAWVWELWADGVIHCETGCSPY